MANMTSARASSVRNELAVTFWGGHRKGPIGVIGGQEAVAGLEK